MKAALSGAAFYHFTMSRSFNIGYFIKDSLGQMKAAPAGAARFQKSLSLFIDLDSKD